MQYLCRLVHDLFRPPHPLPPSNNGLIARASVPPTLQQPFLMIARRRPTGTLFVIVSQCVTPELKIGHDMHGIMNLLPPEPPCRFHKSPRGSLGLIEIYGK